MRIHNLLGEAQNGQAYANLARAFHLPPVKVGMAVGTMIDEIVGHIVKGTRSPRSLAALVELLGQSVHEQVLEQPLLLGAPSTQIIGNDALQVIAGRNESKRMARHAASVAQVSEMIAEYLLPVVAAMLVGALAKASRADLETILRSSAGGAGDLPLSSGSDAGSGPLQLPQVAGGGSFTGSTGGTVGAVGPSATSSSYAALAEAIRRTYRAPGAPDPAKAVRRALAAALGYRTNAAGWINRVQRWSLGAFQAMLAGLRR